MTSLRKSYNPEDIAKALDTIGVRRGDVMFSHLSLGSLGLPTGCRTSAEICSVVHEGVRRVLGPTGTFVVPTYTYSFTDGEDYDSVTSPSKTGPFPEYFRNASGVIRSNDPIFSVAAEGPEANELIYNLPPSSFGPDCIYERMMKLGGINANFGLDIEFNTFVHFVEEMEQVSYRYNKSFTSQYINDKGIENTKTYDMYVRDIENNVLAYFEPLENLFTKNDAMKKYMMDELVIREVDLYKAYNIIENDIRNNNAKSLYKIGENN